MTDIQYEILDGLYFVISFEELQKMVEIEEENLIKELAFLIGKDWVKAMEKDTEFIIEDLEKFNYNYKNYNYLATKAGLFAHNSR